MEVGEERREGGSSTRTETDVEEPGRRGGGRCVKKKTGEKNIDR